MLIHPCTRPCTIVHHSTLLYIDVHNCIRMRIYIQRYTQLYYIFNNVHVCISLHTVVYQCTHLSHGCARAYTFIFVLLCEGMGTRRENSSLRLWFLFFLNCFLNLNKFWIRNFKIVISKVKNLSFFSLEVLFDYYLVLF